MIAAHVVSVPVTGLRGRRQLIMPIDRVGGYRSGTVMHVNVRKDICFPFHALAPVHLCSLCIGSALKNRSRLLQLLSIVEKNRRVKGSELFSRNNNNNNPKRRFLNDSIYIYIYATSSIRLNRVYLKKTLPSRHVEIFGPRDLSTFHRLVSIFFRT